MRLKVLKLLATTLMLTTLFSSAVLAIPGQPHQFFGTVTVNGAPAPDGTVVIAKVYEYGITASTTTKNGKYGYTPIFYVPDPDGEINAAINKPYIHFFIYDVDTGQTARYCNGCIGPNNNHQPLNLEATGVVLPTTTTTSPPSGGGGGGGGGGGIEVQPCVLNGICDSWETHETCPSDCPEETTTTTTTTGGETTTTIPACEEDWKCTKWSACENGVQRRTCTDRNDCGTYLFKPVESQSCTGEEGTESTSIFGFFTGMAATLTENAMYIIGILVAVIVVIVAMRKKLFGKIFGKSKPAPAPPTKPAKPASVKKTSGKTK